MGGTKFSGVEGDPSLTSSSMWTAVHGELLLIFGNLHLAR